MLRMISPQVKRIAFWQRLQANMAPMFAVMLFLGLMSHATWAIEPATKELEDVSDAEKVKWARATKVAITDAIRAALDRTTGQVIEAALHSIRGRLLYEIEVVTKDGTVIEVFVDPQNGKVVDMGEGR